MSRRSPAAACVRLAHGPVTIDVVSDDAPSLACLAEFLAPAFQASRARRGTVDHVVHASVDLPRHAALRRRLRAARLEGLEGFTFDGEFSRHRGWHDETGGLWVHDDACDVFYGVDAEARSVALVARAPGKGTRLALMRVVRELATAALLRAGRLPVHGAAFEVDGGVVLVCGPKRAGKTTLLVRALEAGAAFVSNDRVFVDVRRRPVASGMPTIVMLRDGTLALFPRLRAGFEAARFDRARTLAECAPGISRPVPRAGRGFDRPGLTAAQLCRLLGAPLRAGGPVRAILFPRVDRRARGLGLRRLSSAATARALGGSLLRPSRPNRTSRVFSPGLRALSMPVRAEALRCRRLAARVPAFECRLGRDALRTELRTELFRALAAAIAPVRSRASRRRSAGR